MKAELRISIKDYRQNKKPKILLSRTPFATRRSYVRMNGGARVRPRGKGQTVDSQP